MKRGTAVLLYSWTITLWKTRQLSLSTFIIRSRYYTVCRIQFLFIVRLFIFLGWFLAHDWQVKLIDGLLLHLEKQKKKTCTHWVPTFQLASTDGFISFERKNFFPSIFDYSSSKQTITKFPTQSRIFFCFKVVHIFRIKKLQFFLGWRRK